METFLLGTRAESLPGVGGPLSSGGWLFSTCGGGWGEAKNRAASRGRGTDNLVYVQIGMAMG